MAKAFPKNSISRSFEVNFISLNLSFIYPYVESKGNFVKEWKFGFQISSSVLSLPIHVHQSPLF